MSEWRYQTIREFVGSPISGSRPVGGVSAESEGIPSLGGENIKAEGGVSYDNIKRIPERYFRLMPKGHLQAGDVLINKDGAQTGKVGFYDGRLGEASVNEHLFILRSSNRSIDQKLLYYYLLLPQTQADIARRITGSAQPGLNSQFVDAVGLTVPPLPLQRRIAEILSTVDEAIKQTEALIAKTQAIKAGLMHDLFTRGVLPNGQLRPTREEAPQLYKQSPLGWIPREWESKSLAEWTAFITDYRGMTPPYSSEGIPVISAENISDGRIRSITKYVTEETYNLTTRRGFPEPGDVVFTTEAPVAEVARMPAHGTYRLTRRVIALRRNDDLLKPFMYWSMYRLSKMTAWNGKLHGSTVPRILKPDILAQHLAVPSKNEQYSIISKLDQIEERLDTEVESAERLKSIKRGLMHDLLTGKVRVKISAKRSTKP